MKLNTEISVSMISKIILFKIRKTMNGKLNLDRWNENLKYIYIYPEIKRQKLLNGIWSITDKKGSSNHFRHLEIV